MSADEPLTLDTMVAASSGMMVSEVDGELVMMDIERGTYYGLDPMAARIWQAVAEPTRIVDLCDTLMQRFEVDPDTCHAEVLAFVGDLRREGLVRSV